jgi:hypothetical protein
MGQKQLVEGGEALKRRHKNMTPHASVTNMKQVLTYRRGRFNVNSQSDSANYAPHVSAANRTCLF